MRLTPKALIERIENDGGKLVIVRWRRLPALLLYLLVLLGTPAGRGAALRLHLEAEHGETAEAVGSGAGEMAPAGSGGDRGAEAVGMALAISTGPRAGGAAGVGSGGDHWERAAGTGLAISTGDDAGGAAGVGRGGDRGERAAGMSLAISAGDDAGAADHSHEHDAARGAGHHHHRAGEGDGHQHHHDDHREPDHGGAQPVAALAGSTPNAPPPPEQAAEPTPLHLPHAHDGYVHTHDPEQDDDAILLTGTGFDLYLPAFPPALAGASIEDEAAPPLEVVASDRIDSVDPPPPRPA